MHPHSALSLNCPSSRNSQLPKARYIHSRNSSPSPSSPYKSLKPTTSDTTPYSALLCQTFLQNPPSQSPNLNSFSQPPSPLNKPYKILNAPDLLDNFYYSILDWGSCNSISVGLSTKIFLISLTQSKIFNLFKSGTIVTSLKFNEFSSYLSAGFENGEVLVFDMNEGKVCKKLQGHIGRVGVCKWNRGVLTTGGSDNFVIHSDLRAPESFCKVRAHAEEICGLEWDEDTLATGSNDNTIKIWQDYSQVPLITLQGHTSAVKSMAWSPFDRKVLLTGGGANDRTIKVWDTLNGKVLKEIDSGSQVCSLLFSKNSKEFITGHGYSKNEIMVWSYPGLEEKETFEAHEDRVLYMALGPDGKDLVTGAGDKTLRFWNLFGVAKKEEFFEDFYAKGLR